MKLSVSLLLASPLLVQGSGSLHYTYNPEEESGPEHWKDLHYEDGTENACGGTNNSPIAIEGSTCDAYQNYELNGGDCRFGHFGYSISNHAEQVDAPSSSGACTTPKIEIPGVEGTFELLQFHIHTNSEHSFDGSHFGGEIHLVHKEVGGSRLAVVGLFITPNALESNDIFDHILAQFDEVAAETASTCSLNESPPKFWATTKSGDMEDYLGDKLNPYDLIPSGSTFYNYAGGLTTPPCSEIVEWSVVDKPIEITVAQYTDLAGLILNYVDEHTCEFSTIANPFTGSTSRPVQPLNGRTVRRICPVGFVDLEAAKVAAAASGGTRKAQLGAATLVAAAFSAIALLM